MKKVSQLFVALGCILLATSCSGQVKNAKTETVKIYGNCGMCKSTIEKAGNENKLALVEWDKNTKMAKISFDSTKTSADEILKRIALAGYDCEKFLAPDQAYNNLAGCCQYDRVKKESASIEPINAAITNSEKVEAQQEAHPLKAIFDSYFTIKEALVNTDGSTASSKAKELITAISAVKMDKLNASEHTVWMKVMKDLTFDAEHIEETKDAGHQRDHFNTLSDNMYQLLKVSKIDDTPTYYQHCPMANNGKGANWLSKENEVKNPYYGSKMLSCGKTVEKIR
jgi:hypothetical protein